jgi:hypothetical protein
MVCLEVVDSIEYRDVGLESCFLVLLGILQVAWEICQKPRQLAAGMKASIRV